MIEYTQNNDIAICDGVMFRRDKQTGYYLSSKPLYHNRRIRLHVYVWMQKYGDIPQGYAIHHIDENKNNNDIDNLICMSKSAHQKLHMTERVLSDPEWFRMTITQKAAPEAKRWHKSAEGHNWHKQHGMEVFSNMGSTQKICEYCGKQYVVRNNCKNVGRFCSNNCKAASRRKDGVDDIERKCESCGETFIANKYSTKKYCSQECRKQHRRISHDQ